MPTTRIKPASTALFGVIVSLTVLMLVSPAGAQRGGNPTPGGCGTPAQRATPATPADPGAPGGGATPAQPATPATPANPERCPEDTGGGGGGDGDGAVGGAGTSSLGDPVGADGTGTDVLSGAAGAAGTAAGTGGIGGGADAEVEGETARSDRLAATGVPVALLLLAGAALAVGGLALWGGRRLALRH